MLKKSKLLSALILLLLTITLIGTACTQSTTAVEPAPAAQEAAEPAESQAAEEAPAAEAEDTLEGNLVIYHAGSLTIPFEALENEFESIHPNVDILRTPGGSRTVARKVTELGDKVDILCSADYTVIDTLVMPEFADWNALFAENSMVIMFSKDSKFADEINSDNWYEILTRDGVNFGHSEPNADPCGYRSVLLWQLAEAHYGVEDLNQSIINARKEENIRPKSVELIAMLETGALDYAFEYESVAMQHSAKNPDLQYIKLPVEINLSSIDQKDFYAQATIDLDGSEPGSTVTKKGEPIVYSLTMPTSGENTETAIAFLQFLFDKEQGQKILVESGQPLLDEVTVFGAENLPEGLQEIAQ
jgi:molybdate/tungstate transport system substrate-binding protein